MTARGPKKKPLAGVSRKDRQTDRQTGREKQFSHTQGQAHRHILKSMKRKYKYIFVCGLCLVAR